MALKVVVNGYLIGKTPKPSKKGSYRYVFAVGKLLEDKLFDDPEVLDYWTKELISETKFGDQYELNISIQGEIKQVTSAEKI